MYHTNPHDEGGFSNNFSKIQDKKKIPDLFVLTTEVAKLASRPTNASSTVALPLATLATTVSLKVTIAVQMELITKATVRTCQK